MAEPRHQRRSFLAASLAASGWAALARVVRTPSIVFTFEDLRGVPLHVLRSLRLDPERRAIVHPAGDTPERRSALMLSAIEWQVLWRSRSAATGEALVSRQTDPPTSRLDREHTLMGLWERGLLSPDRSSPAGARLLARLEAGVAAASRRRRA